MVMASSVLCLALVIHNESRGEPKQGKAAVAHVVLNRAKTHDKVCKTVHSKGQFYTKPVKNKSSKAWVDSKVLAKKVLSKQIKDPTKGAKYFHNHTVKPKWKLKRVGKIGKHTFYK